jgi:hypothetical protein
VKRGIHSSLVRLVGEGASLQSCLRRTQDQFEQPVQTWNSTGGPGPWSQGGSFTAPASMTGTWNGTWKSYYEDVGGITAVFTQTGSNITETLSLTNTAVGTIQSASVSGTITGTSFKLYSLFLYDGNTYKQECSGILNGNSASGTFMNSGPEYSEAGTFSLNRQ